MTGTVVIMSGGMDSTTLLYYMKQYNVIKGVLSFYYGQRHARELESAKKICELNNLPWRMVDLSGIMRDFNSTLTGKGDVPEGHYAQENMKQTVVPNRNSIMLSIAIGYAISVEADQVAFGPHSGDHAIYPDCREEYVDAFNLAMKFANKWTPVKVVAPFINMSKAEIVHLGVTGYTKDGFPTGLQVPYELTWTCYRGLEKACGTCGTCCERLEAFDKNGVEDPIQYEDRESWRKFIREFSQKKQEEKQ